MRRWEAVALGLCFASWIGAVLGQTGLLAFEGTLGLSLYAFHAVAAVLGWLSGNIYIFRRRRLLRNVRRRLVALYLLGPPGVLYFLWTLAPGSLQRVYPLSPLLGFGVYVIFFMVPITLPGSWSRPPDA
ncbi:MAG: hypothetical protein R3234_05965 [Thermoanaerobaculia bacterium]|nr:hypothetical protein [Thermoanaerobaculia bacterium]